MNYLRVSLQKGEVGEGAIGYVVAKITDSDLALPWEQFCERYVRPAFEQAAREAAYIIERQSAAKPPAPPASAV